VTGLAPWFDAFVPPFGLILLGALLRARLLPEPAAWAGMERLVFFVLLPALLASSIASADLGALPLGGMAAVLCTGMLLGGALGWGLARLLGHGFGTATSVVQGTMRFNNLTAFAIAGAVLGPPGLAVGAVATGLMVPTAQLVLVLMFSLNPDGAAGRPTPRRVLRQLATNPLILGCALGFAVSLLGGLPPGLSPLARALGSASVALGLLTVGAALTPGALRDRPATQLLTALCKLAVLPAMVFGLCLLVGLPPLPTAVAVLFMGQPTAATCYVMARVMGGDAPLMAAIITSQHLLAVLSLPLLALLLAH